VKRILFILCCTLLIGLTTAACGEVVEEGTTDAVQDDSAAEVEAEDAASPGWVKVFTWKGGSEGNFIRNSKKFKLEGGEQRVDMEVKKMTGEFAMPSADWILTSTDEFTLEMLGTTKKKDSATFYVDAGEYYIESHTLDCTWKLTVYEKR